MRTRFGWILAAAAALAACNDGFGVQDWDATPDTIVLYTLSRADLLGQPSAYDFANRRLVAVETPGSIGVWDVALADAGSSLELVPAAAFQGVNSRAGIATITGEMFDDLTKAPSDTARYSAAAVALQEGGVYVVRTRRVACGFGSAVHYAKLEAVLVDGTLGFAKFAVVVNPLCNDRSFVPPNN